MAPVCGEAGSRRFKILLDAVWPKHEGQNHISIGIPAAPGDHAHQPSREHDGHRRDQRNTVANLAGVNQRIARSVAHRDAVGTERAGNVPKRIAHSKRTTQFIASRHSHAAPACSNRANRRITATSFEPHHADSVQSEALNETLNEALKFVEYIFFLTIPT